MTRLTQEYYNKIARIYTMILSHLVNLSIGKGKSGLVLRAGIGDIPNLLLSHAGNLVITEERPEYIETIRKRFPPFLYPGLSVAHMDLDSPKDFAGALFDFVSCFDVFNHLKNPLSFLEWAASACGGFMLFDLRVSDGLGPGLHFCLEDLSIPGTRRQGIGVCIDRDWFFSVLAKWFPYLYQCDFKEEEDHADHSCAVWDIPNKTEEVLANKNFQHIYVVSSKLPIHSEKLTAISLKVNGKSYHYDLVNIGAYMGDAVETTDRNVLLLEPNPVVCERLRREFLSHSTNVIVENIAVGNHSGRVDFNYLDGTAGLPEWSDRIGSMLPNHIAELGKMNGFPAGFEHNMKKTEVACLTLPDLFSAYQVKSIDRLLVDAEGMDFDILMSIDFENVDIRKIIFERKHMDGTKKTGLRYRTVLGYLADYGYEVKNIDEENDMAFRVESYENVRSRARRFREWIAQPPAWLRQPQDYASTGVVYLGPWQKPFSRGPKVSHYAANC
jgi:FkbM family methyltransferase